MINMQIVLVIRHKAVLLLTCAASTQFFNTLDFGAHTMFKKPEYAVDCMGHDMGIEPKDVVKKYVAPTGNVYVLTADKRVWDVHPNICKDDNSWDVEDTVFGVRQEVETRPEMIDYVGGDHYPLKEFGLIDQETFDAAHRKYRKYHGKNDTWNKEKLLGTL